jgi:hypothetical protein
MNIRNKVREDPGSLPDCLPGVGNLYRSPSVSSALLLMMMTMVIVVVVVVVIV